MGENKKKQTVYLKRASRETVEMKGEYMPRYNRNYNEITHLYHIIVRATNQQDIFYENQDRCKFLKEIQTTKEKYEYEICAYCFMDNHVHLVIYDKNQNISTAMQSLLIRYVAYFNKKYERNGSLAQNRFFSRNIVNPKDFLNVCRYIHQNPMKAHMTKTEEYQWSSYQEYIKKSTNNLVNTELLFNQFSNNPEEAIQQFIEFHQKVENIMDGKDITEYEMEKLTDDQLREIILKLLKIDNINKIKETGVKTRNEMIRNILMIKGTNCNQISRVIGIGRKVIKAVEQGKS